MNVLKKIVLPLVVGFLLILTACGPQASLDEPPVIRFGEDICDACNMMIDDARFAASYVTTAGEVRRFDDIGDMLVHDLKHHEDVHLYWVHDYHSAEWINADNATFVLSPDLTTPMAWGLAAFADPAGADTFLAEKGGTVTSFAQLLADVETGTIAPHQLSDHNHQQPAMEMGAEMEMDAHEHNHDQDMRMGMEEEQD